MSSTQIRVLIDAKGTVQGLGTVENGFKRVQAQAKQTQEIVSKAYKINFNASSFNAVNKSVSSAMSNLSKLNPQFQKIQQQAAVAGKQVAGSFDLKATIPGLNNFQKVVGNVGSAFSAVQTIVTGGLVGAVVIRGISAAVDESVKLQNALVGVESVAKSFGHNTDDVKQAVLDFTKDGLVPAGDAALAFKQILSTGTSLPDAIKLMNSLKDAAALNRQSFYSLGEAIVATTEGIKNGTSARADAVGITTNLSQMDKAYAEQLGTTVDKLSDQQKYQARVNGFIKEGMVYQGDAQKVLDTYSGSVTALGTAYDRALAKIGNFITQSSLVKATIQGLTRFLNDVSEDTSGPEYRIKQIRAQLNGFLKDAKDSSYKDKLTEELRLLEQEVNANKRLNDTVSARKQKQIEVKNAAAETAKQASEAAKDRAKELKALDKALKTAGETELETLKRVREERLKLVGPKDIERRTKIEQDFAKKVNELNQKNHDEQVKRANELAKLNKRLSEEAFAHGSSNIFQAGYANMPEGLTPEQQEKYKKNNDLGRGAGVLNSVVGGKEGAKALVSSAAAAGLDAIAPGLGQAAKPFLDALTQGPEAVKGMVNEFADALPDVIIGFVEAIPVFIETLVDRAPDIIMRLVEEAPKLISKLIADAPRIMIKIATLMPKIALEFVQSLIRNVPYLIGEIARGLYEAVAGLFDGFGGGNNFFSGSADNGFMGTGIHFASGGEVPKTTGTPFKDSVPATLMPGERILDLETNRAFKEFVDRKDTGHIETLLARVIDLLEKPMTVTSETKVNNGVLAQAILQLSRTAQRTS